MADVIEKWWRIASLKRDDDEYKWRHWKVMMSLKKYDVIEKWWCVASLKSDDADNVNDDAQNVNHAFPYFYCIELDVPSAYVSGSQQGLELLTFWPKMAKIMASWCHNVVTNGR